MFSVALQYLRCVFSFLTSSPNFPPQPAEASLCLGVVPHRKRLQPPADRPETLLLRHHRDASLRHLLRGRGRSRYILIAWKSIIVRKKLFLVSKIKGGKLQEKKSANNIVQSLITQNCFPSTVLNLKSLSVIHCKCMSFFLCVNLQLYS